MAQVRLEQVSEYLETNLSLMSVSNDISDYQLNPVHEAFEALIVRLAAENRQESHVAALRDALDVSSSI